MKRFHARLMLLISLSTLVLAGCGSSAAVPWPGYAHLWPAPAFNRPFIVLMCKYQDVPDVPAGFEDQVRRFLTLAGLGTGNMLDYYSDVSYGAVSLDGDRVMGWYNAPFPSTTTLSRTERVKECANAVPASDVDFSSYYGIIMVTNKLSDGGACYVGQQTMSIHNQDVPEACVVFDNYSLFSAFAAHEIGHGLGMPHSYDDVRHTCGSNTIGEYCDPWDIMSALDTFQFQGANFPNPWNTPQDPNQASDGPGLNVPNLLQMGWLRVAPPVYQINQPTQTYTLAALSHPKAPGSLTVRIIPDPSLPSVMYTVEYRQKDGWDAGIPDNTVLVHEYKRGESPYSFLQRTSSAYSGELLTGMGWLDRSHRIQVCVESINPASATATITIGTPSLFGCANGPRVKIEAPANNSHVTAGVPFQLVAKATTSGGTVLPESDVIWQANAKPLGSGHTLATTFNTAGTYNIAVTAKDPSNSLTASDSITLYVDPPAPPPVKPTVKIISPTNGQAYELASFGQSFTLVLSSQASAGVVGYHWSDSLHIFTDSKANDTLTVTPSATQTPCGSTNDTITLTVTDGLGQTASAQVTIQIQRICIN